LQAARRILSKPNSRCQRRFPASWGFGGVDPAPQKFERGGFRVQILDTGARFGAAALAAVQQGPYISSPQRSQEIAE
jgi:hypothetical protein